MSRRRTPWRPLGRPATWEDLESLPDDVIGEIVGGDIIATPRPDLPHARVTSELGGMLWGPFRKGVGGPGGWIILDEPRMRFGEDIRVPDLGGWRAERWNALPRRGPIPLIPDWICEVLSPATEMDDRTSKRDLYATAEVRQLWLIHPTARTLEVFRLDDSAWRLVGSFADDAKVRVEPFDAVELDLSLLWETSVPDDADGV